MEFAHTVLFVSGLMLLVSILAGGASARLGAPVLLVFLALGMLAGDEGPGGIAFSDVRAAYLVGSAALAVILFDGGMRTRRASFRLALFPALSLATLGVILTAVVAGVAGSLALGIGWIEGLLLGAIVASTDAAAVFMVLHHRGAALNERVSATLETESGINDPVAVFLTAMTVRLLAGQIDSGWVIAEELVQDATLGLIVGVGGGALLVWLVNRLELAPGLYPILVLAGGLCIFAGAEMIGGSGYLAAFLGGFVIGNTRLRAAPLVSRFLDGMAWLAQIVLFLVLGLLVFPSSLVPQAGAAIAVALVLIFIARPLAVWICLFPFRFTRQEKLFIAWVGLRGAIPIFLAMFPLLADLPGSPTYFNVAFVVVLASLTLQGWTVAPVARWLGLELPPHPEPSQRFDLTFIGGGREVSAYRVPPTSPAVERPFAELPLPKRTRILAVLREDAVMPRASLDRLEPHDVVLAVVPPEHLHALDRLFAPRPQTSERDPLGDFVVDADVPLKEIADIYGLAVPPADRDRSLATVLRDQLGRDPAVGDRAHFGPIDLIVREMHEDRITRVGISLEPEALPLETFDPLQWLKSRLAAFRRPPVA